MLPALYSSMATIIAFPTRDKFEELREALPVAVLTSILRPQLDGRLLSFPSTELDANAHQPGSNVVPIRERRGSNLATLRHTSSADYPQPAA